MLADKFEAAVADLARRQSGVVSRPQLYGLGVPRGVVRHQIRAGRWRAVGGHCVAVFTGPLPPDSERWAAVLEGGPRAFLDGSSALVAAGLEHFDEGRLRVSVPKGARIQRRRNLRANLRETRRWHPDDLVSTRGGPPRSRPAVAAVRAALWAHSDKQATLLLVMAVQQRLCTPEQLTAEMLRVRRDRRRNLVYDVIRDLAGGVGSLGELELLRGCRDRRLPLPDQQVLRRGRNGTYYLDNRWHDFGVTLEVDGIQHLWANAVVSDAIRHNDVALSGDIVLRLPVLGLKLAPDAFFDQLAEALKRGGWGGEVWGRSA